PVMLPGSLLKSGIQRKNMG
ncbi:hypothetical protein A2U01_0041187, partial [Trifolium medium]|nr:hypothetical protein [Trifolium medium]